MARPAIMLRRLPPAALLVAMALAAFLAFAFALDFPALTGRVVDEANILDTATRAALTDKLADFETKTTNQLVVVTLKSLQGTTIEDFGVQLGRRWAIGQKDKNNGALLIVAPNERAVRIEVGYGLEGTLTDAVSKLIIENAILPRFRANDFAGGIARGVDDIIQALSGDAADFKARAAAAEQLRQGQPPARAPEDNSGWPIMLILIGGIGIIVFCVTVSGFLCQIILQVLLSESTGRGSSSSSGGGFSGGGGSFGGGGASGRW